MAGSLEPYLGAVHTVVAITFKRRLCRVVERYDALDPYLDRERCCALTAMSLGA